MKVKVKIKNIVTFLILMMILSSAILSFSSYTYAAAVNIEKISNPDAGEGETDGLMEGGERGTSYAWATAIRGDYIYIGTNKDVLGSFAKPFVNAMVSAGATEDTAWGVVDAITNGEIPRPTTETGGDIFKCNKSTGEIQKIYTAEKGVAFRMAIEFEGNLYFASYSAEVSHLRNISSCIFPDTSVSTSSRTISSSNTSSKVTGISSGIYASAGMIQSRY